MAVQARETTLVLQRGERFVITFSRIEHNFKAQEVKFEALATPIFCCKEESSFPLAK